MRHDMPRELRQGPFTTAAALAAITPGSLSGPSYRPLLRGVHQASDLDVTYGTRIAAARHIVGDEAVLAGPSAAWALGCRLAGPGHPVHVIVRHGSRDCRDALVRHRMLLCAADVVDTPFGAATSPTRTALDLARGMGIDGLPTHRKVAWLDALLRATGVPAARVQEAAAVTRGGRGIGSARQLLARARDGVDSPKETELRLLVIELGFPEPHVQCPVSDAAGRTLARLDLGWCRQRAGLEYDGAVHREPGQHSRDLARHNRIRAAGWTVFQIDARTLLRPGSWLPELSALVPRH